jgi:hypothetical protein
MYKVYLQHQTCLQNEIIVTIRIRTYVNASWLISQKGSWAKVLKVFAAYFQTFFLRKPYRARPNSI